MIKHGFGFASGLVAILLNACATNSDPCARSEIMRAVKSMPATDAGPVFDVAARGHLRSISVRESVLAHDMINYSGIVDLRTNQAWVRKYGGLDGHVSWYGPITLSAPPDWRCERAQSDF